MALSPADVRRAAELFAVAEAQEGVSHRTDATYDPNYLGQMVGAKGKTSSAPATSSSSSSPSSSSAKPKGKGKAAAAR